MAESEVKIRIHLEIDESDKSAVRNHAKAIHETGTAPIQQETQEQGFGIFAGERIDPGVVGFEKRQKNIRTPFKDTKSKAPFQRSDPFSELKNRVDGIEETFSTPDALKEALGIDPTDFKNLLNIARNPQGFLLRFLSVAGLPLAVITTIISSPQLIGQLIDFLTQRGGPFDKFFKRRLDEEQNPFLSREQQKLRQIGEQGVIFSQFQGFGNTNNHLTTNTLAQVRANGISDIGLRDKAGGF